MNPVIKSIRARRSIRRYTGQAVSRELLKELVWAGMAAPTSRDTRHLCFVVVDDPVIVQSLADALPYAKMLLTAKHAIVVASDLSLAHGGSSTDYWVQDCSAAVMNILLAAQSLGLGTCWTAAHPRPERVAVVQAILGMSAQVMPLCVVAVGYPMGDEVVRDKSDPAKMFYNAWGKH